MFEPIDKVWQVFRVQPCIVMLHVMVISELADQSTAEEFCSLLICPIRVRIVSQEVRHLLRVEISDKFRSLLELHHAIFILGQTVRVLVEQSSVLHILIVARCRFLQVFSHCNCGQNESNSVRLLQLHF